ncbi:MAG: ferric reductase-like transmembrane domain-containing protein [Parcubacteria group bacterium]
MHILFAKISWFLLIVILYMRPLAEITGSKELRQIMPMRKHLGIACGVTAFLHVVLYMIDSGILLTYFTDGIFWSFANLFGWGNIAFVALMIPFLTSNRASQKYFKNRWKKLQMFSYLAFICGGIHVSFATHAIFVGVVPVVGWAIVWGIAQYRRSARKEKTISYNR